ncbi:MAG: response regulator transcription factor [Holophagales bacterium]|nr:response regulator transcription factor [Holophagales bacterium]MBK9967392.1 response regulator transcription factor [Holophagales bacterium]
MIAVFVVDDHSVVREGLKRILEESPDIRVVGEAASAEEALGMLPLCRCDVVVTDLAMPGRGGLELVAEVRKRHLGCRVLILSIHANGQLVVSALREGASGYLTKDSAPTELVHAVRKVAAGGRYVTEALADELAARLGQGGSADEAPPLSRREYTVLALLGAGRTPTEISSELSLSVKTVSSYRSRLLTKLGLRTTSQLVAYALRTGITPGAGPSCWTGTATR